MSVHLETMPVDLAIQHSPAKSIDTVFLVVQRQNGHWSPGAKIMSVWDFEHFAENAASALKAQYPQQSFGIFMLRSEAKLVRNPIEIVRTGGGE